jgi:hypothetical protein
LTALTALATFVSFGTHSFVILSRIIPLGHLFNLTGMALSLVLPLPESTFDLGFGFGFGVDDVDSFVGETVGVTVGTTIS